FWVSLSPVGLVAESDLSEIAAVELATVEQYLTKILDSGRTSGFIEHYRYLVHTDEEEEETRVIFLDCWRSLTNLSTFCIACGWVSLSGLLAVLALMIVLSKWILRPFSENYEKQRQFITDAGHEIKTPLAIINADADILEMELGEGNEWLQDIQKQTKRLTSLTNDLIFLSRTEEAGNQIQMIDFPFSDMVDEMVQSFRSRALTENKAFETRILPMLTLHGDEKSLRQLVSVLLDNALKYSEENGQITVTLERQGKNALFTVSNTTSQPVDSHPERLFDRFYRGDQSHNSQTGGYGIGLSIAAAATANTR
ncbi:MAG: HAMP domain-containing histidine kinase, partial [Clostridiales bacterium]|nr:HAMP domain-containing histidine kinase [Clostridiales bacterium]